MAWKPRYFDKVEAMMCHWVNLFSRAAIILVITAGFAGANDVAIVPESLRNDPAYAKYARIQIQLALLADSSMADLPIFVDSPLPGVIDLRGTAPDDRTKERIVQHALRISGLRVRQTIRVVASDANTPVTSEPADKLLASVKETLEILFPEISKKLTVTSENGVVTLTGSAPSYETCLLLSQSAKSQPGCRAVICRLQVPVDPTSQKVKVSELGSDGLFVAQLPKIPPPSQEIPTAKGVDRYTTPNQTDRTLAADDAPQANLGDRQIREQVKSRIEKDNQLKAAGFEIDVQDGVVSLAGNGQSRAQIELATAIASEVPQVTKVVAKCRPVSIQRFRPQTVDARDANPKPARKKLLGFIPWGGTSTNETPVNNRRFREAVKKTLARRCERDIQDLTVKVSHDGLKLLIEGKVATPQKRVAVFKQLDNLAELRNVPYDAVLQVVSDETN
jgi:osmotically-inducible protein OsmY